MGEKKAGRIHRAIASVMREIGAVGKDSENKEQRYKFRSVEHLYNRVQPLFARHGIHSVPRVIDHKREQTQTKSGTTMHWSIMTVEYTFFCDDGSSVALSVVGEGMDSSDKASSKAMTASHKKAISQLLCLPFAVTDPDAETPEWAAAFKNRITLDDLTGLKRRWLGQQEGLNGSGKDAVAVAFSEWARTATEAEFDPLDHRQWTSEMFIQCQELLVAGTESSEAGKSS